VAIDEADFTQVFRGYDKEEVDRAIQGLRRDLIQANSQGTEANKEIKRLTAHIDDLNAEIEEVGSPTFSGLGTKLENTLRVAEEQSTPPRPARSTPCVARRPSVQTARSRTPRSRQAASWMTPAPRRTTCWPAPTTTTRL